jgi:hypothetical protein
LMMDNRVEIKADLRLGGDVARFREKI